VIEDSRARSTISGWLRVKVFCPKLGLDRNGGRSARRVAGCDPTYGEKYEDASTPSLAEVPTLQAASIQAPWFLLP